MANVLNFYMDDSGTRNPDRLSTATTNEQNWFALGGVMIKESDEAEARQLYREFCEHYQITYPLHSYEIRSKTGKFRWLNHFTRTEQSEFLGRLERFLLRVPAIGLACIIDRDGYNARYREKYGRSRWSLCKTAFNIAVERAAKYARANDLKLRVMPERCSAKDDKKLREYYDSLRTKGLPFAEDTSSKYFPLTAENIKSTLYEFRPKDKNSPMAQIADMYLWPMCVSGYDKTNRPYNALLQAKKLIDCFCSEHEQTEIGIKYFCFESVEQKTR